MGKASERLAQIGPAEKAVGPTWKSLKRSEEERSAGLISTRRDGAAWSISRTTRYPRRRDREDCPAEVVTTTSYSWGRFLQFPNSNQRPDGHKDW